VAYLDVEVAGTELGTIEIGLFGEIAPKTVTNFITILTKGINGRTYAGTKFHRVFNKFVIQGSLKKKNRNAYTPSQISTNSFTEVF